MRERKLIEIVQDILIGQIMKRVSYKEGEKTTGYEEEGIVLLPSVISGGIIHRENLGKTRLKKKVSPWFYTQKDDIIIKLSSPYNCALITGEDVGFIVPSFCAIIRGVDSKIMDVRYLTGFLNSSYAVSKLTAGMDVSGQAMLRKKSLEDLVVEEPRMHVQVVAGRAYWASCRKKYILQKMADQQQVSSDSVIIETLKKENFVNEELEKLYREMPYDITPEPKDQDFLMWDYFFYGKGADLKDSLLFPGAELPAVSKEKECQRTVLAAFVAMMKCLDDNRTEMKLDIPNSLLFPMFAFTVEEMPPETIPYDELKTYLREIQSTLDLSTDLDPDFLYNELERCGLRTDMEYLKGLFREVGRWEFKGEPGIKTAVMGVSAFINEIGSRYYDGMQEISTPALKLLTDIFPIESGMKYYGIMDGNSILLPLLLKERAVDVTVNTDRDNEALAMILLLMESQLRRIKIRSYRDPWIPVGEKSQMGTYDIALVVPPSAGPTNVHDTAYKYGSQEADSLIEWFPQNLNCGDWIYARHMIKALSPDGTGYIILPLGMLSRMGTYVEVRRLFLDSDVLDTVIEFAPGAFGEKSTALLIMKKKRDNDTVYMVNLSGKYGHTLLNEPNVEHPDSKTFKPKPDLSRITPIISERKTARFVSREVTKEEIAENGYCFSPSAYITDAPNLAELAEKLEMSANESEKLEKEYIETCRDYDNAMQYFQESLEDSSLE